MTKGKKKGPKYSYEECVVLTHMTLYPGSIHGSKTGDVTAMSEVFNRSEASIRMTIGNARTVLFQTGKLKNASTNIKKACSDYKGVSRNVLDKVVHDILTDYDYNIR